MVIAISYYQTAILISLAIIYENNAILFWTDFAARILFYVAAVFIIRVPLHKLFPKSKKIFLFSYAYALIGIILATYQFFIRNIPLLTSSEIANWGADVILADGITIMLLVPWAATSYIFINEFIRSKFSQIKPFLLGAGFFLICVGGIFQDLSNHVIAYLFFSILLAIGFLFALAGMFFE